MHSDVCSRLKFSTTPYGEKIKVYKECCIQWIKQNLMWKFVVLDKKMVISILSIFKCVTDSI